MNPPRNDEIGDYGWECLAQLRKWLGLSTIKRPQTATNRPSLTARSEADLFSISSPRFASRVYLDENKVSFVNARRLDRFIRRISQTRSRRTALRFRQLLETTSPIGDSLLVSPPWLKKRLPSGYHLIATPDLRIAYGELKRQNLDKTRRDQWRANNIEVSPYIQHVPLGGGLCAQAACFICNAILAQHANGIHGVAEMTALFNDTEDNQQLLELGGMDSIQIAKYFAHDLVGLNATVIKVEGRGPKNRFNRPYFDGLRAYLLSNMPVIMPVDLARLDGRGFLDKNGYDLSPVVPPAILHEFPNTPRRGSPSSNTNQFQEHAVVLVGCEQSQESTSRFIVHDPATAPFLTPTLHQLISCAPYLWKKSDLVANTHLRCPSKRWDDESTKHLQPSTGIAVTPRSVKLPVGNSIDLYGSSPRNTTGLYRIAGSLQAEYPDPNVLPRYIRNDRLRHTRLVQLRQFTSLTSQSSEVSPLPKECANALSAASAVLQSRGVDPMQWCWVQYLPKSDPYPSLWIWNAELPTPTVWKVARFLEYILSVFRVHPVNGSSEIFHSPPPTLVPKLPSNHTLPDHPRAALKHSLVSSFVTSGLKSSAGGWPRKKPPACELYALFEGDLSPLKLDISARPSVRGLIAWFTGLWSRFRMPHETCTDRCVVDCLARFGEMNLNTKDLADAIVNIWHDDRKPRPPIVSMATFVPEISSPNERIRAKAVTALTVLMRVMAHLRDCPRLGGKEHRSVMEIVAGSRIADVSINARDIDKVFVVANSTKKHFVNDIRAHCRSTSDGIELLVESLRKLAPIAIETSVTMAVELEPGPLYLVHDWRSLQQLADCIEKDPDLCRTVGFNADISHWNLAGIRPYELWSDDPTETKHFRERDRAQEKWTGRRLLSRIVHAHVSDCGIGHFGDVIMQEINDREIFDNWIRVLGQRAHPSYKGGDIPFSGYVSVELEAIGAVHTVPDGVNRLLGLLNNGNVAT